MSYTPRQEDILLPPRGFNHDESRYSVATTASGDVSYKAPPSTTGLNSSAGSYAAVPADDYPYPYPETKKPKRSLLAWFAIALGIVALIAAAVIVPVYFKVIKPNNATADNSNTSGSSTSRAASPTSTSGPTSNVLTTGGDGSKITKDDGSSFTYNNKFGGYWVWDPKNPYNNSARAQSWSPPLSQAWNYGVDQIRGVNLGGWLVLEPWIVPGMYEPYQPSTPGYTGIQAVDEYTLSQAIAANASSGGLAKVMEDHYKTFITEEDFAMIAGAGLNWVRLPIPFWAVSKFEDEPYLEGVAWNYFLKAIDWARKYGLRINLDLHTIPGSQNGYDHSGKLGSANWMHGVMGIANGQRALNIMRSIAEFISRDEIKDVVPMFGVLNEPPTRTIGIGPATSFYLEMHDMIRNITGPGKGPFISIHDGFYVEAMADFLPGSDRIAMDSHVYFSFAERLNPAPLAEQVQAPCTAWGGHFNSSLDNWGFITAGEWSLGFNDCAYYLNGAERGYRYDGTLPSYGGPRIGSCDPWLDSTDWTAETKANLRTLTLSSMDAMQNYFFWTWRVGESIRTGKVNSPLWSYKLGLENGWMPTDPRTAAGQCGNSNPRANANRNYTPGTPTTISAAVRNQFPFPPAALEDQADAAILPRYTPTGTPRVMPAATYADATVSAPTPTTNSNGWRDYVPITGCEYPNQWDAVSVAVPAQCTGA